MMKYLIIEESLPILKVYSLYIQDIDEVVLDKKSMTRTLLFHRNISEVSSGLYILAPNYQDTSSCYLFPFKLEFIKEYLEMNSTVEIFFPLTKNIINSIVTPDNKEDLLEVLVDFELFELCIYITTKYGKEQAFITS